MPTTNKETWRDWGALAGVPEPKEDELLTRAEVLDELERRETPIPQTTIVEWEKNGLLPRAIVKKHKGKVQATYPPWFIDAAIYVRRLTSAGIRWDAAKEISHAWVTSGMNPSDFSKSILEPIREAIRAFADWYVESSPNGEEIAQEIAGGRFEIVSAEGRRIVGHSFNIGDNPNPPWDGF